MKTKQSDLKGFKDHFEDMKTELEDSNNQVESYAIENSKLKKELSSFKSSEFARQEGESEKRNTKLSEESRKANLIKGVKVVLLDYISKSLPEMSETVYNYEDSKDLLSIVVYFTSQQKNKCLNIIESEKSPELNVLLSTVKQFFTELLTGQSKFVDDLNESRESSIAEVTLTINKRYKELLEILTK